MALKKAVVTETAEETLSAEGVEATTETPVEEVVEVEAATETPVEEVETPAEEAKEISNDVETVDASQSTEVKTMSGNAMTQFTQDQAEAGYEGLELTGMSFDRIKLHEGQFKLGSDEIELGSSFDCIIYGTRQLYIVRQDASNDAEAFYSYDAKGKTFTDGTSAAEKLQEWIEEGYGTEDSPLDIRPYLEATAVLTNRDDEHEGLMVMLSIPPASTARVAGVAAQAKMRYNKSLAEVVTRATVGNKIGEGQKAFRPWTFKMVGSA